MIDEKNEKAPAFKVIDKRGVVEDEDDCCKDHHHDEHQKPSEQATEKKHDDGTSRPPMSFSMFIQSLAHQSMMGLGIVPWPDTGLVKLELDLAKETIDILQILKDKSKGNLTHDEQVMLDSILYQLQVAFVEISKNPQEIFITK